MATEYILENLHTEERVESDKKEFKHLFGKSELKYGKPIIEK